MIHVELKDLYTPKHTLLWAVLSFKAGMINTAGFLLAGSYVSHVTGFGTQIGIAIGHDSYDLSAELLVIPLAFIGGAIITSLILDRPSSSDQTPNYSLVQLLITLLLGLVALLYSCNYFGTTVQPIGSQKSILLITLLCLICGLKNALTTCVSHGKIRITHLTGLSTDVGIHFPKMFRKEGAKSLYPEAKCINQVRIVTLLSFSLGACLAALLIPKLGGGIFYLFFTISLVLFTLSLSDRRKLAAIKNTRSNKNRMAVSSIKAFD